MRLSGNNRRSLFGLLLVLSASCLPVVAQEKAEWLRQWQKNNPRWYAVHLIGPSPEKTDITKRFVADVLKPLGINVLVFEVNYNFQFRSHPELECSGITKAQARELARWCRRHGIRLIPLFNCLGHQSWRSNTFALLKKYPQFDETPNVPPNNEGIYCREWCPSNPQVYDVVFDLLDELIDAFEADALHVGMDEVFLIGNGQCPRCRGKDVAQLFASVVNRLHEHLVEQEHVEMLMWGDRLLEAKRFGYSRWEASETGSHRAIDLVPKDIIPCDWHYRARSDYPSVDYFQEKGFRVLPATWNDPKAAELLARYAKSHDRGKMLGILFTSWGTDGNGQLLYAALTGRWETLPYKPDAKRKQNAERVARAMIAGLKVFYSDEHPERLQRVLEFEKNLTQAE